MNSNRDTILLDLLEEEGKKNGNGRWICRGSTRGRGLRLHQVSDAERGENHALTGLPTFETPREAVEDFLDRIG